MNAKKDSYHVGQRFTCSHCNSESVVRIEREMIDWFTRKEILVCAFCGIHLAEKDAAGSATEDSAANNSRASEHLQAFLGESDIKPKTTIDAGADEKQFCRDCRYYVYHPFLSRCARHGKEVEPMQDCEDYEIRSGQDSDVDKEEAGV